jgi:galactokinase
MTGDRVVRLLDRLRSRPDRAGFLVPGRIEVLGKHTDYAGGRSLLCATPRGFAAAVAPRADARVRITDVHSDQTVELDPEHPPPRRPAWAIYPATVLRRVRRDFQTGVPGCDILIDSDLPSAAGLSSSSALIIAVFLALDAVAGLADTPAYRGAIRSREELAGYLAAVERGTPFAGLGDDDPGVGTRGGGQDHTAILCAEPGQLVRYAFEPTRREGIIDLPSDWTFVVASSGVKASKTGNAQRRYNELSDLARLAGERWRRATGCDEPHLGAIAAAGPDAVARLRDVLWCGGDPAVRDALRARVRHFLTESEVIIPAAADALAAEDLETFGRLVDQSQALAHELLGNQVPQTTWLAAEARRLGAAAASAFGAGFGGSVWALVPRGDSPAFLRRWRRSYQRHGAPRRQTAWFLSPPAPPAHIIPRAA